MFKRQFNNHSQLIARTLAASAMLASAAAIAFVPASASLAATGAHSASEGGTSPGTPTPPPPVIPGVRYMDRTTGWVFPIREVNLIFAPSRWTLDQGVDMGGTSSVCGNRATLLAVDDAVVSGIGISGFGSQSPIIKLTRGPLKGRQVYYGHSSPVLVKKGQHVKRGQAIARIGCGIVGYSSAPHLEIGLYRKGATYCCPSWGETAPALIAILKRMWPTAVARNRQARR